MSVRPSGFKGLEFTHSGQVTHSKVPSVNVRQTTLSALWMSQACCWCQRWLSVNPADMRYYFRMCHICVCVCVCNCERGQVIYVGFYWPLLSVRRAVIHLQSSDFQEGSFESHKVFHTGIQQMPATLQRSKACKNPINSVKPEEMNRKWCIKCKYACVLQH